jgi:cytochrome c-type biogenesis protein CcmH
MALWLMFVLMTAAAILAVLWPLSRHRPAHSGSDVAVYRDQLDEITRDRAAGLIGEAESEAARVEVSRRLLAAADASAKASPPSAAGSQFRRRAAAVAGLTFIPIVASALYLTLGSPQLPGEPLAARAKTSPENRSIESLVSQVESHLELDPNDGRGWEILAPVYLRLGRFDDAVKARRNALRLNGEATDRQADLGEALVALSNGIVTADAKSAFERAVALDAADFKAQYFLGLAAQQDGNRDKAASIWRAMLDKSPPNAPWAPTVRNALADLGVTVPPPAAAQSAPDKGPSAEDVAAAAGMSDSQRTDMIRGMVAGLATRLAQDGSDVDGWLRLLRAYMVLGERDKAQAAAADARRALASDPDKLRRVDEMVKGLGLT